MRYGKEWRRRLADNGEKHSYFSSKRKVLRDWFALPAASTLNDCLGATGFETIRVNKDDELIRECSRQPWTLL
ncbi:hypothetical protein GCM10007880_63960 [Mesorhizobium amorphae]|nr:hypothetical protein GCM10007880_63960 [Mesorhizobium amorphae]